MDIAPTAVLPVARSGWPDLLSLWDIPNAVQFSDFCAAQWPLPEMQNPGI